MSDRSAIVRFRVYAKVHHRFAALALRQLPVRDLNGFEYTARRSGNHVRARTFVRAWAKQNAKPLSLDRTSDIGAEMTVFRMAEADFGLLVEATPILKSISDTELVVIYDVQQIYLRL